MDTKRARQSDCRASLGWSAKQWQTLTPLEQSVWNALSGSGTDGAGKMCGRAVVVRASAPIPAATPPAAAAPGAAAVAAAFFALGNLFVDVTDPGTGSDRLDFWAGAPRAAVDFAPGRFVLIDYATAPTVSTYGIGAGFVAQWGTPTPGHVLPVFAAPSTDGLLGTPSAVVWAVVP